MGRAVGRTSFLKESPQAYIDAIEEYDVTVTRRRGGAV
jgi:hypothetical protein